MANEALKIYGDRQLIRQFQQMHDLGAKTHNFRSVFNRASKPMKLDAKTNASGLSKNISRSILMQKSKRFPGVFWIGPRRGKSQKFNAWYAYFHEKGTKQRKTKKGGYLRGRIKRGQFFMRRAYERNLGTTKILIRKELYKELSKIAAKRLSI